MKFLVTGSSGHLGEAIIRTLINRGIEYRGIDILPSKYTTNVGSIADRDFVKNSMPDITNVLHTATLHKPHVATHTYQNFVDTNITGTLNLLEESAQNGVNGFIFTSTTSTFGDALTPDANKPAAWITEDVKPIPKNIYGVTKTAAEDLCQLFHKKFKLPVLVLRTSRFFPEDDDNAATRAEFSGENAKTNELLYRRADIEDIVSAHLLASEKATEIGFDRYIISATTPFQKDDLEELHRDAPSVVKRIYPFYDEIYKAKQWKMFPVIDRVYVNRKAREELGWTPQYSFELALENLKNARPLHSELTGLVGSKGYHAQKFKDFPYPVS